MNRGYKPVCLMNLFPGPALRPADLPLPAPEEDVGEWINHVGVSCVGGAPAGSAVVFVPFGGGSGVEQIPSSSSAEPAAPGGDESHGQPLKKGTDFEFVKSVLGNDNFAQLRNEGYSLSFDKRPPPFGSYSAVFYPDFSAEAEGHAKRRSRPTMIARSRVMLVNENDHAQCVAACFNMSILPCLMMGSVAAQQDEILAEELHQPASDAESHSGESSGEFLGVV
jgi:hypothetical protein